mmetsp:Transcript_9262/g.56400  ORF Transcript_9262/g.56400 Transcript_9262/m.56400 type:complete len:244 (+) Transcript_9262:1795-2526(+)
MKSYSLFFEAMPCNVVFTDSISFFGANTKTFTRSVMEKDFCRCFFPAGLLSIGMRMGVDFSWMNFLIASSSFASPSNETRPSSKVLKMFTDGISFLPSGNKDASCVWKKLRSLRNASATFPNTVSSSEPSLKAPTTTTSSDLTLAAISSADDTKTEAGPACFVTYLTIPAASLGPSYSMGSCPFLKIFKVGNPRMPYLLAIALFFSSAASNLARCNGGSSVLSSAAAFSYSGASALQCPHHGA